MRQISNYHKKTILDEIVFGSCRDPINSSAIYVALNDDFISNFSSSSDCPDIKLNQNGIQNKKKVARTQLKGFRGSR